MSIWTVILVSALVGAFVGGLSGFANSLLVIFFVFGGYDAWLERRKERRQRKEPASKDPFFEPDPEGEERPLPDEVVSEARRQAGEALKEAHEDKHGRRV